MPKNVQKSLKYLSVLFLYFCFLCAFLQPVWGDDFSEFDFSSTISGERTIQAWTDESGVPHIVASSTAGVYWGYGYFLAKERMFQLELLRRSVNGTLSELFGKSFLEADFTARRDGISGTELSEGLNRSPRPFQTILSAFTAGINAAVRDSQNRRIQSDPAFSSAGISPTSFSEIDILNIFAGTMAVRYNDFTQELDNFHFLSSLVKRFGAKSASRIFEDVVFFEDPFTTSTIGPLESGPLQIRHPSLLKFYSSPSTEGSQSPTLRNRKRNEFLKSIGIPEKSGSYAVALSNLQRGKSEAFILAGPQMGYFKPSALFEVGLHTPEFDIIGATPTGYLAILFGANRKIGFTATAGVANLVDIVSLSSSAADPNLLVGKRFQILKKSREEKFIVKGEKKPVVRTVEETDIGPVIAIEGKTHYVKNRAWKNLIIDSYSAWLDSNHSRNLDEWLHSSDRMSLSINWIGGDRDGHIAYSYCGQGKTRKSFGDDRLPSLRPTEFPYPDVRISGKDPGQGFFVNWNCPPFDHFRNGDLQTGWGRDQRTAFLEEIVVENKDRWSLDFLKELDKKIAFQDLRAFFFREILCRYVNFDSLSKHCQDAFSQMTKWDGSRKIAADGKLFDHPGAGLFDAFWSKVFSALFAKPLGEFIWMISSDPTWTQSSILYSALRNTTNFDYIKNGSSTNEVVTGCFKEAVDTLASEGKPLPCAPCPPMEFLGVNHAGAPTQVAPATFTPLMNRGSIVQLMSLTPAGIEVWAVLPPGNGSFGNFEKNQISDFRNFVYRKRALELKEVRKTAKKFQVLKIPDSIQE